MDLVDDAPAHTLKQLLRATGEHQVQRLRGGDQDVGRLTKHLLALSLGRIPGANRDFKLRADPAQRGAQVAIDVVGERLQGGDVDQADPALAGVSGRRLLGELVDCVQERRQRLPRARGGRDQDVLAGGDRRPGLDLSRCGCRESAREPFTRAGAER